MKKYSGPGYTMNSLSQLEAAAWAERARNPEPTRILLLIQAKTSPKRGTRIAGDETMVVGATIATGLYVRIAFNQRLRFKSSAAARQHDALKVQFKYSGRRSRPPNFAYTADCEIGEQFSKNAPRGPQKLPLTFVRPSGLKDWYTFFNALALPQSFMLHASLAEIPYIFSVRPSRANLKLAVVSGDLLLGNGIYEQTTIQYPGSTPEELEASLANEVARRSLAANKNPEQREIENALRFRNQLLMLRVTKIEITPVQYLALRVTELKFEMIQVLEQEGSSWPLWDRSWPLNLLLVDLEFFNSLLPDVPHGRSRMDHVSRLPEVTKRFRREAERKMLKKIAVQSVCQIDNVTIPSEAYCHKQLKMSIAQHFGGMFLRVVIDSCAT
ncbi:hypothetical protein BT96DRAFT_935390 [Gymnopus androsaceus JB14]|uniref:Uncharacterized protein n=1 Tax=Gymnopus androsaceus JB14 TaxID=1447944 RepID=A0A6A4I1S6_9AGAR|nr:hypothetical protein BT96DRAFT_935390 [Gymnopus androsaceus JB14]